MMHRLVLRISMTAFIIALLPAFFIGCTRPFYLWEAHTTSTATPQSFDVSTLAREPVAVLLPATYNHLQGYVPLMAQGLSAACSEMVPPIHILSQYEMFNKLNHAGVTEEYMDIDPTFAASRVLDARRLKKIGETLGVTYVLQSGLAYVGDEMEEKFEIVGWHLLKTRISTLGLWLRLWNAQTGEFLWEGAGEATIAAELLEEGAAVPFHEIARRLWTRMIEEGLVNRKAKTRSFMKVELPFEP